MVMGLFALIFVVIFGLAAVTILSIFGFTFFNVFRFSSRFRQMQDAVLDAAQQDAKKKTAMDVMSQLPPGTAAHKCRNCGATVDSTAELSPDGRVRCNYCNQWTSIYQ